MSAKFNVFILISFCVLLYFIGITSIHLTDPDEVFYAETAKEMLAHKSFLTPLIFEKPQFEKPPLFYWLLMLSFKIFGANAFAARLVPSLCGIAGVLGTYIFMKRVAGERVALYAGSILASSFLYFGLAKTVLTDTTFAVFASLCLYAFYVWYRQRRGIDFLLFAVFLSLAVLTKGPLAIAICLTTVVLFLIWSKGLKALPAFIFNKYWLVFLALGCTWYFYASMKYGKDFLWEFFVHDNWHRILYSEHKNFDKWFFYPALVVGGMFPWTFYLLMLGQGFKKNKEAQMFFFSWIIAVFLVLTPAHSKLISYILPVFPAVCCSLALSLEGRSGRMAIAGLLNILLGLGMLLILPFLKIKSGYSHLLASSLVSICILCAAVIAGGIFLIRGKVRAAIFTNIIGLILFVLAGVLVAVPGKLETAFSDCDLKKIVAEYQYQDKPIVSSKLYVRGVYFYTHNPVLVIDNNKNPFWSRHPLEVLSTEGEIITFFSGKDAVLCVIQHDDLETLERVFSGKRENKVISRNFDRFVVWSRKL